jgi:hypothetical protein
MYDDVRAWPAEYWDELTRAVTAPDRHAMFLACADVEVTGCTYGLVDGVGGGSVPSPWGRSRVLRIVDMGREL